MRGRAKQPSGVELNAPSTTAAGSTVERLAAALRERIREGLYVPGQRLIEAQVRRDLGVSRGPIREALRRLAGEGLVSMEHYRGARVTQMSRFEVAAQYEVREVIEGLAAKLAAERITNGGGGTKLRALWRELTQAAVRRDSAQYSRLNEQLHALIVELSGNPHLPQLSRQLAAPIFRLQFRTFLNPEHVAVSHAEHERIVKAILAGDGSAAERAIKAHIRHAARSMDALPEHWWPRETNSN